MLNTIIAIILILWVFGVVSPGIGVGIHGLLGILLVLVILRLLGLI